MKINSSRITFALVIVVVIIIKLLSWVNGDRQAKSFKEIQNYKNRGILILTKHARCRMECRHITIDEIKEVLRDGKENYSKSTTGSKGDQTFAIEGVSSDQQHIRVVVAPKNEEVVVITCIDLDKEWPCNCN